MVLYKNILLIIWHQILFDYKNLRICKLGLEDPWRRMWKPTPMFLPGKSMVRGAWCTTVHGVAKSGLNEHTQHLEQQNTSAMRWDSKNPGITQILIGPWESLFFFEELGKMLFSSISRWYIVYHALLSIYASPPWDKIEFTSVQLLGHVQLLVIPWTAASLLPCPSPTPEACSNSCPLSWWCQKQPSHPLSSPSPVLDLSPHQGRFQWVSSSHQVAKVLEFQHQSFL